ncbi:MAG: SxtJ family membrane protein [Dehalococcoidia bacterium]
MTPAEGRKFGFTVGAAFAVLAGITWWRDHPTMMQIFSGLAVVLILAGAIIPGKLGPVYKAWMGLALLISKVTTPIFLGIVYFVVITPIGFAMRLFGWNPLRHGSGSGSVWQPHSKERGTMSNQF